MEYKGITTNKINLIMKIKEYLKTYNYNSIPFIVVGIVGGLLISKLGTTFDAITGAPTYNNYAATIIGSIIMTAMLTIAHAKADHSKTIVGAHYKRFFIRALVLGLLTLLVYPHFEWKTVFLYFINVFTFGIVFDPFVNWFDGNPWWYAGKQAWYDRFIGNNPKLFAFLELQGLILSGILFFYV